MDQTDILSNAICTRLEQGRPLQIGGMGSKRGLLSFPNAEQLSTTEHHGLVDYQPSELVVTARSGTTLKALEFELAREHQMLACDPPQLAGRGTLGGAVASGLSGPMRVGWGSVSDAVLGVQMINGRGEQLNFGGQVMKNVAGYDVSRLLCGSYGTLGLILQVSLRTQPIPDQQRTLRLAQDAETALQQCRSMARQPLPLVATFWHDGVLHIALRGTDAAVRSASRRLGGEPGDDYLWPQLRDQRHDFFNASLHLEQKLVRVSVPPGAPLPDAEVTSSVQDMAVAWHGALRWFWCREPAGLLRYAQEVGGWAYVVGEQAPIAAELATIMRQIKLAFDPEGLFVSPLNLSGDEHAH